MARGGRPHEAQAKPHASGGPVTAWSSYSGGPQRLRGPSAVMPAPATGATGEKTKKHSSWFCEWHGARSASAGAAKLGSPAPALDMSRQLRRRVGGGGGGGGGSAKICSVCNESKGKGCFSKRQWNQIPDKRKCMDCTEEGGVQGRGGGGRGGAVGNRLLQAPPPARTGAASVNQQAEDTSGISWHRCLSNSFTLSLSRARSLSLSLDR